LNSSDKATFAATNGDDDLPPRIVLVKEMQQVHYQYGQRSDSNAHCDRGYCLLHLCLELLQDHRCTPEGEREGSQPKGREKKAQQTEVKVREGEMNHIGGEHSTTNRYGGSQDNDCKADTASSPLLVVPARNEQADGNEQQNRT